LSYCFFILTFSIINTYIYFNSQKIKEELLLLKQSEDLSEIKLIKLINQFNDLKKEINSFQLIKSSNSNFLKVEKQQIYEIPRSKTPTIIPYNEKHSPHIEQTHSKREG